MDYKDKYIKYKTKYLELKNINSQIGGSNLIIHISRPQEASETTLGNKIKDKDKYGDHNYLKDLDDLYVEFSNQKKINKSLYEDKHPAKSTKGTGFKNKKKALDTLKIIKDRDIIYQKQVVNTMFNRAKYHPYQTDGMREAMKVFKEWLDKFK